MKKRIILNVLIAALILSCTPKRDNPLDPDGDSYTPPSMTLDLSQSNIPANDTLTGDSIVIPVEGNSPHSQFRYKIDGGAWTQWQDSALISASLLDDGRHVMVIETRYKDGTETSADSVRFTVALLPDRAVYFYRWKQTYTGDTAVVSLRTKGLAPTFLLHCEISGAKVGDIGISYADNTAATALYRDSTFDILILPGAPPIEAELDVAQIKLTDIDASGIVNIRACVLKDSLNAAVALDTARGTILIRQ
jgi:hypothetical protein